MVESASIGLTLLAQVDVEQGQGCAAFGNRATIAAYVARALRKASEGVVAAPVELACQIER
jgi:hypothetical protein